MCSLANRPSITVRLGMGDGVMVAVGTSVGISMAISVGDATGMGDSSTIGAATCSVAMAVGWLPKGALQASSARASVPIEIAVCRLMPGSLVKISAQANGVYTL